MYRVPLASVLTPAHNRRTIPGMHDENGATRRKPTAEVIRDGRIRMSIGATAAARFLEGDKGPVLPDLRALTTSSYSPGFWMVMRLFDGCRDADLARRTSSALRRCFPRFPWEMVSILVGVEVEAYERLGLPDEARAAEEWFHSVNSGKLESEQVPLMRSRRA